MGVCVYVGLCGESGCVGVAALIDSKFVSVGVVVCGCDCVVESECVYVVLLVWLCRRKWSFMHVFHVCILCLQQSFTCVSIFFSEF